MRNKGGMILGKVANVRYCKNKTLLILVFFEALDLFTLNTGSTTKRLLLIIQEKSARSEHDDDLGLFLPMFSPWFWCKRNIRLKSGDTAHLRTVWRLPGDTYPYPAIV
jgi:hypothetical protein